MQEHPLGMEFVQGQRCYSEIEYTGELHVFSDLINME